MIGVLGVNKPSGMSSFDVIRIIKQRTGIKRIGHGGTLDPLAEGVLPVLIGDASVFFDAILTSSKTYEATISLGAFTDTDDAEGSIIEEIPVPNLTLDAIKDAIKNLSGDIMQIPPKYSALKIDGKRAYDIARSGGEVNLAARKVTVHGWENITLEDKTITATISCSSGTYIRSLARSLGELLGTAAHLSGLKRTRCGGLTLENCVDVKKIQPQILETALIPLEKVLDYMPRLVWNGSLSWLHDGKPLITDNCTFISGSYDTKLALLVFNNRILGLVRSDGSKWAYQRNLSRLYDSLS
ncbi:MAG: tRNA pseudouridine(55) synthase TruB [Brevinema sp.]